MSESGPTLTTRAHVMGNGTESRSDCGSTSTRNTCLSAFCVIKCATKTGAEIMGRGDEFGTVEVGKLADLLIVEGDVAKNIALLSDRSKFVAVMQAGVIKAGRLA